MIGSLQKVTFCIIRKFVIGAELAAKNFVRVYVSPTVLIIVSAASMFLLPSLSLLVKVPSELVIILLRCLVTQS